MSLVFIATVQPVTSLDQYLGSGCGLHRHSIATVGRTATVETLR